MVGNDSGLFSCWADHIDLITAFIVAFAAVTASELLARIWEYF
jgi:hypothetical protein